MSYYKSLKKEKSVKYLYCPHTSANDSMALYFWHVVGDQQSVEFY